MPKFTSIMGPQFIDHNFLIREAIREYLSDLNDRVLEDLYHQTQKEALRVEDFESLTQNNETYNSPVINSPTNVYQDANTNEENSDNQYLNFNENFKKKPPPEVSRVIEEVSELDESNISKQKGLSISGLNNEFFIKINDKEESRFLLSSKTSVADYRASLLEKNLLEEISPSKNSKIGSNLQLDGDLEQKINKIIYKQIKEEDLEFMQRKISQEIKKKRHSVHFKEIKMGVSSISKIEEKNEIEQRGRRSSSIDSYGRSHKDSNESRKSLSKFSKSPTNLKKE